MNFGCVTLKGNAQLTCLYCGDEFWSDKTGARLNNGLWGKQLRKSLKAEKVRSRKMKPGIPCAIITSHSANELLTLHMPSFQRRKADPKTNRKILSGADSGVELQIITKQESEIASLLAEGKVPIGIERKTRIRNCIIDKNAKIGKNVVILNKDGLNEADRPEDGFHIRSGITIMLEKATIEDGMVI